MKSLLLAFVLLVLCGAQGTEKTTHPWCKWKPGSFVKLKVDKDFETIYTLKEVKENSYTLGMTSLLNGKKLPETPMKSSLGELCPHCSPTAVKTGPETLTLEGKDYACSVYTVSSANGGRVQKVWMTEGLELPLKIYVKTPEPLLGEETIVATKLSEDLAVGKKKVKGVVYEGKGTAPGGAKTSALWLSTEVPGGVVKRITSVPGTTTTEEAVDFEARK